MTVDLEARLRQLLRERAEEVEADAPPASDDLLVTPLAGPEHHRRPAMRALVTAAAIGLAVVTTAGLVLTRSDGRAPASVPPVRRDVAPAPAADARAWPLTDDEPLDLPPDDSPLRQPETTVRAYLAEAADLPLDWPLGEITAVGERGVASYVLQDVPAQVRLARAGSGAWYVVAASTDFARLSIAATRHSGVDLQLAKGPRGVAGMSVRLESLAADGEVLATTTATIPAGDAATPPAPVTVPLRWTGTEQMAVARATVLDDHDDDPSTPDVIVGLWTEAVPEPSFDHLPVGFDPRTTGAVFRAPGGPDDVALAYLRDRFPDYPSPGVEIAPAETRGRRGTVRWEVADVVSDGTVLLRRDDLGTWEVVGALTGSIDLSDVRVQEGRVAGRVTSTDDDSIFADVLDDAGRPVAGAERPAGFAGATYRFGTAGGPGTGALDLDVRTDAPAVVLRVNLVGGTILAVAELRITSP